MLTLIEPEILDSVLAKWLPNEKLAIRNVDEATMMH